MLLGSASIAVFVRSRSLFTLSRAASTVAMRVSRAWNSSDMPTDVRESSSRRMVCERLSTSESTRCTSVPIWSSCSAWSNPFFSRCAFLNAVCSSRTFSMAESSSTTPSFRASSTTSSRSRPRLNMLWKSSCLNLTSLASSSGVMMGFWNTPSPRVLLIAASSVLNSSKDVVVRMRRSASFGSMWRPFMKSTASARADLFHAV